MDADIFCYWTSCCVSIQCIIQRILLDVTCLIITIQCIPPLSPYVHVHRCTIICFPAGNFTSWNFNADSMLNRCWYFKSFYRALKKRWKIDVESMSKSQLCITCIIFFQPSAVFFILLLEDGNFRSNAIATYWKLPFFHVSKY